MQFTVTSVRTSNHKSELFAFSVIRYPDVHNRSSKAKHWRGSIANIEGLNPAEGMDFVLLCLLFADEQVVIQDSEDKCVKTTTLRYPRTKQKL